MMRHQQRMQYLGFYEEAVGDLMELTGDEGFLIARISKVNLVLPHEMENKLRPLMCTRIGILRTDIPGKEYLFRVLPELGQKTDPMTDDYLCENEQISNCCEAI